MDRVEGESMTHTKECEEARAQAWAAVAAQNEAHEKCKKVKA